MVIIQKMMTRLCQSGFIAFSEWLAVGISYIAQAQRGACVCGVRRIRFEIGHERERIIVEITFKLYTLRHFILLIFHLRSCWDYAHFYSATFNGWIYEILILLLVNHPTRVLKHNRLREINAHVIKIVNILTEIIVKYFIFVWINVYFPLFHLN